jgi:hypothetical protein
MEMVKVIIEGATIIVVSAIVGYNLTGFATYIYRKIKRH